MSALIGIVVFVILAVVFLKLALHLIGVAFALVLAVGAYMIARKLLGHEL